MIQPDKQVVLRRGQLIRVCADEECTKYLGYAVLLEALDEGKTLIEGRENEFDNECVFLKQRWKVRYVEEHHLPPNCSQEEIFNQRFVANKETSVYLYEHVGKWRELKKQIIENEDDIK